MPKHDNSHTALAELITQVSLAWRHRPGNEVPAAVLDTFDALHFETRAGQKPVLAHKHKEPYGWHLVFCLPPGISARDIEAKLDHFQEQVGGRIELKKNGKLVHFDVFASPLPDRMDYDEWNPFNYPNMALPFLVGATAAGPLVVDLARLPHIFVAGQTGGGKTTALQSLAVSLIQQGALLAVIDLKGLDFNHLTDHALVVDDEADGTEVLAALNRELNRRKKLLKAAGVNKLQDYPNDDLPWIACIVDELGEFSDNKEAQAHLNRLGRLARAVGICLICATQRPSHSLYPKFTDFRMLFSGRLCFWMPKPEDSMLILENDTAARLPANIPGRAIWQWSGQTEVQCAYLDVKHAKKLLAGVSPKGVDFFDEPSAKRLPPR